MQQALISIASTQGLKKGEHTKSFIGSTKGLGRITGSTHSQKTK